MSGMKFLCVSGGSTDTCLRWCFFGETLFEFREELNKKSVFASGTGDGDFSSELSFAGDFGGSRGDG